MTARKTAETDGPTEPELSYEEAREELNTVVRRLESGGLTLKESLALWERGEGLAKTCEEWLEGARAKLAVALAEDGEQEEGGDAETPF
ncbi:exodeoxyribonuclease VII small subunit [Spinactinospora alkalitolerans]|uniref:Exodeoxyribonuclease 7 small subunit n=1 Tax=Spinactinospora alkalitolerans TaxID=687207 RepID=A0A852TMT8_9ACTN|nr:exodeoxyribonuclease VII small subunit [Spinactinospora alkalitolerans]NYE45626.1 exodeoxyribonuclease VII small subunit [Spinactinospora alkalitolerans]